MTAHVHGRDARSTVSGPRVSVQNPGSFLGRGTDGTPVVRSQEARPPDASPHRRQGRTVRVDQNHRDDRISAPTRGAARLDLLLFDKLGGEQLHHQFLGLITRICDDDIIGRGFV